MSVTPEASEVVGVGVTEPGEIWAEFVDGQLTREFDRRSTLDAKGLAIVTSSGTLVSLVFAIGAVAIARKDVNFVPTLWISIPATIGLALFVMAAALGLWATRVTPYLVADTASLEKMRTQHWKMPEAQARSVVVWYKISTLDKVRSGNNSKALLVLLGLVAEVGAVTSLAVGIGSTLWSI